VGLEGVDYVVMGRLFRKGYILYTRGRAKSIVLTEEGRAPVEEYFGGVARGKQGTPFSLAQNRNRFGGPGSCRKIEQKRVTKSDTLFL
jgi:hypothetical protein